MNPIDTRSIRLVVIDDHAMFRDGLACLLEREPGMSVAGCFGSSAEAVEALPGLDANMILLDYNLGSERTLDFVAAVKEQGFTGCILVVTAGLTNPEAVQLIGAGVRGIVHKHNSPELLCTTIRKVARGDVWLEPAYLGALFGAVDHSTACTKPDLTPRDKAVMRLIFQGLVNKEIAERLNITEGAVKASLRLLFEKLGVRTRSQLVRVALEQYRDEL